MDLWDGVKWEISSMDVEPTNLQQLCDGVQHLAKSMLGRIKADLRAKRGLKVYHIKCINK